MTTQEEFKAVLALCRDLFLKKMHDYGTAWRIMRPESITDQLYIKANRIRTLQMTGVTMVGEGIAANYMDMLNYAVFALIKLVIEQDNHVEE